MDIFESASVNVESSYIDKDYDEVAESNVEESFGIYNEDNIEYE